MTDVLIADDHRLLRETMREMLELQGLTVVGDTGDGVSAVALAKERQPAVVLLDVEMPGHSPVETVRQLGVVAPTTRVIVLSMHDDPLLVRQMLQAGVAAYLHKSASRENLLAAIRSAVRAGGDRPVTVTVSRANRPEVAPETESNRPNLLSRRELEVLTLVGQALSNRQIASRLSITEGTVKRHMRNVFAKLGASSRLDAVNRGAAAGLLRPRTY